MLPGGSRSAPALLPPRSRRQAHLPPPPPLKGRRAAPASKVPRTGRRPLRDAAADAAAAGCCCCFRAASSAPSRFDELGRSFRRAGVASLLLARRHASRSTALALLHPAAAAEACCRGARRTAARRVQRSASSISAPKVWGRGRRSSKFAQPTPLAALRRCDTDRNTPTRAPQAACERGVRSAPARLLSGRRGESKPQ
jgi:hypothetical protein